MAARRHGPAESAHRSNVHPAVLRRKREPRDLASAQHHARHRGGDVVAHARPAGERVSCVLGRCGMTEDNTALEQAVTEIRDEVIEDAVVEAAATRVWARLAESTGHHIRGCADFQSLIPEYRAGRLTEGRAMLLQDHLHQCVACRHVFEGKVVTFPAPGPGGTPARRTVHTV